MRDFSSFGGALLLARVVTVVLGIYLANHVGPAEYGIWGLIAVFAMYGMYGHLGAASTMQREIPVALSQGREGDAHRIAQSALGFVLFSGLALGLGAVMALILFQPRQSPVMRQSLWLLVPLLSGQLLFAYVHTYLRAYQRFQQLALAWVCQASLLAGMSFLLIPRWGVPGYVAAWGVSYAALVVGMLLLGILAVRPSYSRQEWWWLVRTGLPLMLLPMMFYFVIGIDRLVIAPILGMEGVGYYTTALFPLTLAIVGCQVFIETLYPRLAAAHGRGGETPYALSYFLLAYKGLSWLLPWMQGLAILVVPAVYGWLLPGYKAAIVPAQLLLVGMSFFGVAQLTAQFFGVVGEQNGVLKIQGVVLIAKIVVLGLALHLFRSVGTAAIVGTSLSVAYALALVWRVGAKQGCKVRLLAHLVVPWGVAMSLVLMSGSFSGFGKSPLPSGPPLLAIVSYVILTGGVLWLVARRTASLKQLLDWRRGVEPPEGGSVQIG